MSKNHDAYDILAGTIGDIMMSGQDHSNTGNAGNVGNDRRVDYSNNPRKPSPAGSRQSQTKVHCYKLDINIVGTIANIAYWQRRTRREVVEEALLQYIDKTPDEDKRPRLDNKQR